MDGITAFLAQWWVELLQWGVGVLGVFLALWRFMFQRRQWRVQQKAAADARLTIDRGKGIFVVYFTPVETGRNHDLVVTVIGGGARICSASDLTWGRSKNGYRRIDAVPDGRVKQSFPMRRASKRSQDGRVEAIFYTLAENGKVRMEVRCGTRLEVRQEADIIEVLKAPRQPAPGVEGQHITG